MRTRTTVILLIIAGLLGFALMKSDRLLPKSKGAMENPLPFEKAKIDQVIVESAETSLTLTVVERRWQVGKPVDDVADPERVDELLAALENGEWLDQLKRDEMSAEAWQLTGLEKPLAHVQLLSAGQKAAECWVGNASAIEGACYLAVPGAKEGERAVHVVRTTLPALLKKPVESWRDDHLLRVPAESVSRIVLSNATGSIEMARAKPKAPWDLVKPLQTRGHNERINELLATILGLKITAVSATDALKTTAPADALKLVITTPAFSKPVELTLLTPPDVKSGHTQATILHREHTYTIASDRLEQLWSKLNDLRDDHLARVEVDKVNALGVKSNVAGDVALQKDNDRWMLMRNDAWEPANGDRITKLFEALNEHRVKEFVADSAANVEPYGLEKPFLMIAWNDGEKPATDAASGSKPNTVLLFGQDKEGNVFAKYEGEPFVYRVGASILNAVPRDTVRWKATTPVRFSQFALRQIAISIGTNPPVVLDYNPISAEWKGTRAGTDITAGIDRVKADRLADKLGGLTVEDWAQNRTDGTKALQVPAITLQVTLLTVPGKLDSPTQVTTINFAPTVAGEDTALYFGRVNAGPDIFLITRSDLRELLKSVMKG